MLYHIMCFFIIFKVSVKDTGIRVCYHYQNNFTKIMFKIRSEFCDRFSVPPYLGPFIHRFSSVSLVFQWRCRLTTDNAPLLQLTNYFKRWVFSIFYQNISCQTPRIWNWLNDTLSRYPQGMAVSVFAFVTAQI